MGEKMQVPWEKLITLRRLRAVVAARYRRQHTAFEAVLCDLFNAGRDGHLATLALCQIVGVSANGVWKHPERDGWFYRSDAEWLTTCRIDRRHMAKIRPLLERAGVQTEKRLRCDWRTGRVLHPSKTWHYRLDATVFAERFAAACGMNANELRDTLISMTVESDEVSGTVVQPAATPSPTTPPAPEPLTVVPGAHSAVIRIDESAWQLFNRHLPAAAGCMVGQSAAAAVSSLNLQIPSIQIPQIQTFAIAEHERSENVSHTSVTDSVLKPSVDVVVCWRALVDQIEPAFKQAASAVQPSIEDGVLVLLAQNAYQRDLLVNRLRGQVRRVMSEALQQPNLMVRVEIAESVAPAANQKTGGNYAENYAPPLSTTAVRDRLMAVARRDMSAADATAECDLMINVEGEQRVAKALDALDAAIAKREVKDWWRYLQGILQKVAG